MTWQTSSPTWQNQLVLQPIINRTPKEAIIVLLDISGSMTSPYFQVAEMDRMSAVKAFFNAFADRTMAYDFHHAISLVLFNNQVKLKCDFTDLFTQFKTVIDTVEAQSTTELVLCFVLRSRKIKPCPSEISSRC